MGWMKWALLAICVSGTTCFASAPSYAVGGERQEIQSISSWIAHLNVYYPDTELDCDADLSDSSVRQATLEQLEMLEDVLRLERRLPSGYLLLLSCSNIVCGGKN